MNLFLFLCSVLVVSIENLRAPDLLICSSHVKSIIDAEWKRGDDVGALCARFFGSRDELRQKKRLVLPLVIEKKNW